MDDNFLLLTDETVESLITVKALPKKRLR